MMNIERVLRNERLMHALTGMSAKEFGELLPEFEKVGEAGRMREYRNNPKRERKPGGGKKGFLKTSAEKLFFILLHYKCYPTYDVMSFLYACDRSAACRRQQHILPPIVKTVDCYSSPTFLGVLVSSDAGSALCSIWYRGRCSQVDDLGDAWSESPCVGLPTIVAVDEQSADRIRAVEFRPLPV